MPAGWFVSSLTSLYFCSSALYARTRFAAAETANMLALIFSHCSEPLVRLYEPGLHLTHTSVEFVLL
jgi:hypothetical protein